MSSAGTVLGRHLRAVTDGETGERDQWIGWQVGKLTSIPGIEVAGVKETSAPDNEEYSGFPALALDASVTHMYAPGTRRHIKGALALGATMEEIMETLKIATSFGQETINMAIPILAEEIAAFEKKK